MSTLIPPAGGSVPPDDLPKEHVERPPLPWRAAVITECGLAGLADAPRLDEARRARRTRGLGAG